MQNAPSVTRLHRAFNRRSRRLSASPYPTNPHRSQIWRRRAEQPLSHNRIESCRHNRDTNQSAARLLNLNTPPVIHSTTTGRSRLQQVDADTFRVLTDTDESPSPIAPRRNALISDPTTSNSDDKSQQVTTFALTSKSPQTQRISGPEGQQLLQISLNNGGFSHADAASSPSIAVIFATKDEMNSYFDLLENALIAKFLRFDGCRLLADKYLLAMVFMYFSKAKLSENERNPFQFFTALYLAHDMEEEEEYKFEIFSWALGEMWKSHYKELWNARDQLWKRMDYHAVVSQRSAEEVMAIQADHPIWRRERMEHHSGAIRPWLKSRHDDGQIIGPDGSPRHCELCEHDSLSPDNDRICLQLDTSGSSLEEYNAADITGASAATTAGFNMNDVQQNLVISSNSTGKYSSGRGLSLSGHTSDNTLDWVDCDSDIGYERHHMAEV